MTYEDIEENQWYKASANNYIKVIRKPEINEPLCWRWIVYNEKYNFYNEYNNDSLAFYNLKKISPKIQKVLEVSLIK